MKACEYALKDVGIMEVNPRGMQNQGFTDKAFEADLLKLGWRKSQAYCAYAVMRWLTLAADSRIRQMSPSTVSSFNQFRKQKPALVHNKPAVNSLVIWQKDGTPFGHIGIVTEVLQDGAFKTVEGNTSVKSGSEREGDGIGNKLRSLKPMGGLLILGFIYPE